MNNILDESVRNTVDDASIDRIVENLLHIMPVLHKKVLRMDLGHVTGDLTRLHFAVMGMLSKSGLTASELAKIVPMPKSQVTLLVDQLVQLGIVARQQDTTDRRVVNLTLTEDGRALLTDMQRKVKGHVKEKLAGLTTAELAAMSQALDTLRSIGDKL